MAEYNTLEDVLDEWQSNFSFQQEFKKNPEKALREAGLSLSPTDLDQIKILFNIDDENLPPIINK